VGFKLQIESLESGRNSVLLGDSSQIKRIAFAAPSHETDQKLILYVETEFGMFDKATLRAWQEEAGQNPNYQAQLIEGPDLTFVIESASERFILRVTDSDKAPAVSHDKKRAQGGKPLLVPPIAESATPSGLPAQLSDWQEFSDYNSFFNAFVKANPNWPGRDIEGNALNDYIRLARRLNLHIRGNGLASRTCS
jgi:hypothetical protein